MGQNDQGIREKTMARALALILASIAACLLPIFAAHGFSQESQTGPLAEAGDSRFEEAERLFSERDFDKAEPLFRQIPETSPNYPEAQLRLGTIYYAAGQPDLAEKFLRAHLQFRESPEAYTLLAGVQLNQGKFDRAIESARKAISVDGSYSRAHSALGMIYTLAEDFSKAHSAFHRALELDKGDANTWFLLGRSYFLSHEFVEAKEALEEALRLNPQFVEIYTHLGQTLDRMGDSTAAEKIFSQGIERNRLRTPPDKRIHIAFGQFLAGLNRTDESCTQLRAVTQFAPQDPEGHYELAKVLFQMKRFAEAAEEGERATTLDPSDYRIHYLLARIYTALGKANKADEHARLAVHIEQQ